MASLRELLKSERRNFSSIATIRIGWKVVGGFYGMLLLSATSPRHPGRRENTLWKTIWTDGKTPYERRFGQPFKEPIIVFLEQWLNIIRFQREIDQGFINFSRKCYSVSFLAVSWSRWELGKETLWLRISRNWKTWTHQKFILKDSTRKKYWSHKKSVEFSVLVADGTAKLSGRDYEFRQTTLRREPQGTKISAENFFGEPEESQPTEPTDDAEALVDFWSSSSQWTSSSTLRVEGRNIPHSTQILIWMCWRQADWRWLECRFEQTIVKFLERIHKVQLIENKNFPKFDKNSIEYQTDENWKRRSETKMETRSQISTMLEDWEEFTLLIQTTENTQKF